MVGIHYTPIHTTFFLYYINYNKYVLIKNICMYCINDQNIILWFINFDIKYKRVVSSKFMATSCRKHLSF